MVEALTARTHRLPLEMMGQILHGAAIAFALLTASPSARAHRLDEILQVALIAIDTDSVHLELNLTPGIETFERLSSDLDPDRSGEITAREAEAYADLVKDGLALNLDGSALDLQVRGVECPPLRELRTGLATMKLELEARASLEGGPHELHFANAHGTNLSVYLANALMPRSPDIDVQQQTRSPDQREIRIAFTRAIPASRTSEGAVPRPGKPWISGLMMAGMLGLAILGVVLGNARFRG